MRARAILLSTLFLGAGACSKNKPADKGESGANEEASEELSREGGDLEAAIAKPGDKKVTAYGADGKSKELPVGAKVLAETDTYIVKASVPESLHAGSEGKVSIFLSPKEGWKINQDFPTSLEIVAPDGASASPESQRKDSAQHFGEKGATFEVAVKADSAGEQKFSGNFRFAVCTDATCDPKQAKLAFAVTAQ